MGYQFGNLAPHGATTKRIMVARKLFKEKEHMVRARCVRLPPWINTQLQAQTNSSGYVGLRKQILQYHT